MVSKAEAIMAVRMAEELVKIDRFAALPAEMQGAVASALIASALARAQIDDATGDL